MSVVGYRAQNHRQQVAVRGALADVDDRATDWEDFRLLDARFGFTIDAAATPRNAKLPRYWTPAVDGLEQSWAGERVWCNPPYSHPNLYHWVTKAWREFGTQAGPPELVVMLVPANRTEQVWWQRWVEPYRDRADEILHVEFLPGRMRFVAPGANGIGPNERPPFGCCLLIWGYDVPDPLPVATQADLFGGAA